MLELKKYRVLSFDCYGTLIDWEKGILKAILPVLFRRDVALSDAEILEQYAALEAKAEAGPYIKYRDVLRKVMQGFGEKFNFSPNEAELNALPDSLKNWKPFPDTVEALLELKQRFKLAVISNTDDALFAETARHLRVRFDWIVTAEQVKSYKPSKNNFKKALEIIGAGPDKVMHVAQSVYHDIIPAKRLGFSTVLVRRRGHGATPPTEGQPDLEVPDLKTLASMV
ncbi:MAG: haloacid dehalogenase type II [candidate division Zixibacteria bacterium]|nr:haloacid dehalogenase type II [candidate division Zixibacteria bacterium]MCI0595523.1 haloacid dehalogenase type II [candidate division Zixibacteria bacterium]